MTSSHPLEALISPRSIAIIGASDDPRRIGGRPIQYLQKAGYEGTIYPINPKRETVQGIKAYPQIGAVPGVVDCAIVAVAAEQVLETVRACADHGVRSVIIFSSGFAEVGAEGKAAQAELTDIARRTGMRIVGPNVVGLYNAAKSTFLTFSGAVEPAVGAPASRISIVSQSGGFAGYLLAIAEERALRFGKWITTGNEADVELSELIAYLAGDPDTDVIIGYIEGIRSGDAFMHALAKAHHAGKPVILLKVGRTERGAEAAASHTASLAGSDVVFDAVCAQFGVHRADTAEAMLDIAYAASQGQFPSGKRVGVMTVSGGVGVQIADFADAHGLDLPQVPADAQKRLTDIVPFASPRNPVDITAQITNDPSILERSLDILLETSQYDAILVFLGHAAAFPALADKFCDAIAAVRSRHPDQILVLCALGSKELLARYQAAGCLVFKEASRAVAALAAIERFGAERRRTLPALSARPVMMGPARYLNEYDAKQLLKTHGVGVPGDQLATTAEAAGEAADAIGYPVALKIVSADIVHKSDVGGVALRLADRAAVVAAAQAMLRDVPAASPTARIDGVLVGPMVSGGTECIVGLRNDAVFGPVVMFGLGGTAVELLRDVTFRVAPVSVAQAREMIADVRSFPLLDGYRGKPKADVDALAQAVSAISQLPSQPGANVISVEVNPLLALEQGNGVLALDAVIETADARGSVDSH